MYILYVFWLEKKTSVNVRMYTYRCTRLSGLHQNGFVEKFGVVDWKIYFFLKRNISADLYVVTVFFKHFYSFARIVKHDDDDDDDDGVCFVRESFSQRATGQRRGHRRPWTGENESRETCDTRLARVRSVRDAPKNILVRQDENTLYLFFLIGHTHHVVFDFGPHEDARRTGYRQMTVRMCN